MLDAALVSRLNSGEDAAIREVLDKYLPYFHRQATKKNIPDLESEFWIRCFHRLKSGDHHFETPEAVSGFIKQVCHGVVPDYISSTKLITLPANLRRLGVKAREVTIEFLWGGDSDEIREDLYEACENDLQRAILTRRIAGQTSAEIARALETSRSSIYYHLKNIRDRYGENR